MNNIVIVEDKLKKGISLAEQFMEIAEEHPEYNMHVSTVCHYLDYDNEESELEEDYDFEIVNVGLFDFDIVLDEYLHDEEDETFIIIDYILQTRFPVLPTQRVNIRYARMDDRLSTNRIWFYTTTGVDNERTLCKLVGSNHVFGITESNDSFLRLRILENDYFLNQIEAAQNVEV